MNRDQPALKVCEVSILKGEFRLRSGQTSTEYFDKYLFEADPVLLRAISAAQGLTLHALFRMSELKKTANRR